MSPLRVRARFLSRLVLTGTILVPVLFCGILPLPLAAQEMPRAFAARALRFVDGSGGTITGNFRDAHWNSRGNGLFFTLEANGTRNIWRAFPNPKDKSRFPAWLASPITHLKAPQGAARPVPLPGDKNLVCLRLSDRNSSQLAILNITTGNFTRLARTATSPDDPAPSPDGRSVAFTGDRGGQTAIFLTNGAPDDQPRLIANDARRPVWLDNQTLLYESLDAKSPGLYRITLQRDAEPEVVMVGGGEAGALPGGIGTVFAARAGLSEPTRLYLLARDGTGLRVLKGTEGARRPVPSDTGNIVYDAPLEENGPRTLWILRLDMSATILPKALSAPGTLVAQVAGNGTSDARTSDSRAIGSATTGSRATLPPSFPTTSRMAASKSVPHAEKTNSPAFPNHEPIFPSVTSASLVPPLPPLEVPAVTPAPSGPLNSGGTVGSSGPPGTSRDNYSPITSLGPLSPGFGSSIFSTPGSVGTGEASSPVVPTIPVAGSSKPGSNGNPFGEISRVRRAVLSSARVDAPNTANSSDVLAIIGTLSGADVQATLEVGAGESPNRWTSVPVTTASVFQAPFAFWTPPVGANGVWTLRLTVTNRKGAAQSFLRVRLPLPRPTEVTNPINSLPLPPPAPAPTPTPVPTPEMRPAPRPVPFGPLPPAPIQTPMPIRTPSPIQTPVPAPQPGPTPVPLPPAMPTPAPPATFVGTFNISGTLATMAPGQKARVTFWGVNRGNTAWKTGTSGTGRVRLVARWVDFSTGTRRKWNVIWLKAPIAAGGRGNWQFDIEAPTRPGKYKLIYGLVRWPDDNNFSPPPYNAPQAAWAGEFSAIAFAIDVVPPSAP